MRGDTLPEHIRINDWLIDEVVRIHIWRTCCAKDHPKRPLQINESFINLLVKHNLYAAGSNRNILWLLPGWDMDQETK